MQYLILLAFLMNHSPGYAYNSVTCENARQKSGFYGPFTFIMGTVFQVGDCALIDAAKFEFGTYFDSKKEFILHEVNHGYPGEAMIDFTRALGCKKSIYNLEIGRFMIASRAELFGAQDEKSGREVMLGAKKLIRENKVINEYCASVNTTEDRTN
ncbi:MAG: hypothetical protein ACK5P7_10950 [Bdellovibrio sp.]|jgi:hypothetical protein